MAGMSVHGVHGKCIPLCLRAGAMCSNFRMEIAS